jgi:hypothetical protein
MAESKGTLVAASVAGLLTALLAGCGGGEPAPGSGVQVGSTGGTGGAAGAGGSLALGNKAGTGGLAATGGEASAGAPTVTLHACGMPEQPCARNVHMGDVVVRSSADATALLGVTSIMGDLTIDVSAGDAGGAQLADAFECLELVAGDVAIALGTSQGDASLWGLRNLTTIDGNLTAQNVFNRTYTDCGLARLQRVGTGSSSSSTGSIELEGLAGELDLSLLTSLNRLRVSNTELTRMELPASGAFQLSSLEIESNLYLAQIAGFVGVTVQTSPQPLGDVVRITNNPRLSQCDAINIGQRFILGGADPADIVTFGNQACLPQ